MPEVASWLARLGLDKYIEAFTANEVDFDALRHLREDDLKELGLPIGPRRKILAAILGTQRGKRCAAVFGRAIHQSGEQLWKK